MGNEYQGYLIGWKNIGRYLGRSQRTVQRWELKEGLPVLRDPSGSHWPPLSIFTNGY